MQPLDPLGPILGLLFQDGSSDYILGVLSTAGITTEFNLAPEEEYSHNTRKRAYRNKLSQVLAPFDQETRHRIAENLAKEMTRKEGAFVQRLPEVLASAGWAFENNRLVTNAVVEGKGRSAMAIFDKKLIQQEPRTGSKIFIGHGRSQEWRALKDFVQDRLRLEWDEFNREPVAGFTTQQRLQKMLEEALFALIVMTAEDEHPDGSRHPRENVIHEAGLFQGRLGFGCAIILLEEGCAKFSNIDGLTVIPFPQGRINAAFEEIRRVLERERVVSS